MMLPVIGIAVVILIVATLVVAAKPINSGVHVERQNGSTHVTWAMYGPQPYMVLMSLFMGMDKMVGGQFEQGLANLKIVSEAEGSSSSSLPAMI